MSKYIQILILIGVFVFLGMNFYSSRKSKIDPLIAQSTYLGPKSRISEENRLVRVEVLVKDSPEQNGGEIQSVQFDGQKVPLKPRDIYGNRGGASFQKEPGVYLLKWVVNQSHVNWPRNTSHEEIVTISPRDLWVQVSITGETASIR